MKKSQEVALDDIIAHNPECTSNIPIPDLTTIPNRWDFEKLYRDIKEHGIQGPITLIRLKNEDKERYEVVDGLQRLRVAEQLGFEKIQFGVFNNELALDGKNWHIDNFSGIDLTTSCKGNDPKYDLWSILWR